MVLVDVENCIQDSLDKLVEEFLCSVEGDDSKLTVFLASWSILDATVRRHSDELQQSTLASVRSVAATVSAITSSILDLQDTSNRIQDELDTDIVKILNDDLDHLSISGVQESQHRNVIPPYIKASHSWLLANLHNPYPSNRVKNLISQQTNTPVKTVDSWFIDARRRIGWNTIRKTRFSSQAEMIDAATTFFNDHDPPHEKRPRLDYHIDFVTMQKRALTLYEHQPDSVESRGSSSRKRTPSLKQSKKKRPVSASRVPCAYPSPAPSRSGSPRVSAETPPLARSDVCNPRKRSITPTSLIDESSLPCKRQRVEVPSSIDPVYYLPSPVSSICLLDNSDASPSSTLVDLPSFTPGKRKRDSSSDHDEPISKRLHCSSSGGSRSSTGFMCDSGPEQYDLMVNLPLAVTASADYATPVDITVPSYSFSPLLVPKEFFSTDCSAPTLLPSSVNPSDDDPFFISDHLLADFGCLDALGLDFAPSTTRDFTIQSNALFSLPLDSLEFADLPSDLATFFDTDHDFLQSFHSQASSSLPSFCR